MPQHRSIAPRGTGEGPRGRPAVRAAIAGAFSVLAIAGAACTGPTTSPPPGPGTVGTTMEVDSTLANHTIYRPTDLAAAHDLPIVAIGQSGCLLAGDSFKPLFSEIAAHGYLVVADLLPGQIGSDNANVLTRGIDWAIGENTRAGSKYQGKLDTARIATLGHSCGGLLALHVGANDPRVSSVVALDSGIFETGGLGGATKADLQKLHGPTMWLNTGPNDIAYPQAVADYAQVPARVPAVFANYDLTERGNSLLGAHMGTVSEARGGEQGRATVLWLDFTLKGDRQAGDAFLPPACQLCGQPKWTVQAKNWP
jgi:pimeloyl-ACP methyl ester carboxylesterase